MAIEVQETKTNPSATANKLWAGQYTQDATQWVSSHGSDVSFSFSLLGWPPNSSHLQVLSMRIFLSGQKFYSSHLKFQLLQTTFYPPVRTSIQVPHRTATGVPIQMRSILRKGWGDERWFGSPDTALDPALHSQSFFAKKKKQTKLLASSQQNLAQVAHTSHGLEFLVSSMRTECNDHFSWSIEAKT